MLQRPVADSSRNEKSDWPSGLSKPCKEREAINGPQHKVNVEASADSQPKGVSEGRADHVPVKATDSILDSERMLDLPEGGDSVRLVGNPEAIHLDEKPVPPTDRRLGARISVGRFGQLLLYRPSGWRVIQSERSLYSREDDFATAVVGR